MTQISKKADAELDQLSKDLGVAAKKIAEGTQEHDDAWVKIYDTFEEFGQTRFLANDGYYLYKQQNNPSPKLDPVALKNLIFERYPERKAKQIWAAITEPVVSSTLVEQAIQKHLLDATLVTECINTPESTYSRIRREWTKEDYNRAKIFEIQLDPGA